MACTCKEFAKELIIFCREIRDVSDNHLMWKKFRDFTKQSPHLIMNEENGTMSCSQRFCTDMLIAESETLWTEKKLSILLLEFMGSLYLSNCDSYRSCQPYSSCILFPFTRYLTPSRYEHTTTALQTLTALYGDFEYLKLLVNLDLMSNLNDDKEQAMIQFVASLNLCEFITDLNLPLEDKDDQEKAIIELNKIFFRSYNHQSLKRIHLTTIAVRIAQFEQKEKAKQFVHFLRMYFATKRDPFLTINEVRSMLYVCLSVLDKLSLFQSFYEKFIKLMPECSAKLEPRNLSDLARCQVRESLKNCNLSLPTAVEKLMAPQPLKEFILGDVIEMPQKTGNVFPDQIITESELAQLASEYARP